MKLDLISASLGLGHILSYNNYKCTGVGIEHEKSTIRR